ncbi:22656_t:CDS:2 [Rhizophagus irregularis]|nr:22656_t:CDS:2 [Rhizophagus irregularis]
MNVTENYIGYDELQIYWQEIIKECDPALPKKKQDIKESDKNLTLAEISQPDTSLPKKTSKDSIKNLSKTLQSDLQEVIKEYEKENLILVKTSQPDILLSKKNS